MAQAEAIDVICMACEDPQCDYKPMQCQRRAPQDNDIEVDILYSGVCHSDLHTAADHLKDFGFNTTYPFVGGHEGAGIVVKVGPKVTRFKVGDHVGIGCMVDSCKTCVSCKAGLENKCKKCDGAGVSTYNGKDQFGRAAVWPKGSLTKGTYSNKFVIHEDFGVRVPKTYPLEAAGPVMCAGITMYAPLVEHGAKAGTRVAVVGLGGLGSMGIKIAHEMGCVVTAISRGTSKQKLAQQLGAHNFLDSKSEAAMATSKGAFDLILDTVPAYHDVNPYRALVATGGTLVLIGITPTTFAKFAFGALTPSSVAITLIGSIKHTEEVVQLCDRAQPKIVPSIVLKPVQELNAIYSALDSGNDTGERFVLDIKNTLNQDAIGKCNAPKPVLKPAEHMSMKTVFYELFKLMGCLCCQS